MQSISTFFIPSESVSTFHAARLKGLSQRIGVALFVQRHDIDTLVIEILVPQWILEHVVDVAALRLKRTRRIYT